jgi:hypothetical protein
MRISVRFIFVINLNPMAVSFSEQSYSYGEMDVHSYELIYPEKINDTAKKKKKLSEEFLYFYFTFVFIFMFICYVMFTRKNAEIFRVTTIL